MYISIELAAGPFWETSLEFLVSGPRLVSPRLPCLVQGQVWKRENIFVSTFFSVTDWYLGCFIEKPQERAFNISAGNYMVSDTSAQDGTSACAFLNQSYAATEGELCFCTSGAYNIYGKASNESQCNITCSDLPCDDTSYIRVYSTQDAIRKLKVSGPQTGWLLQDVNFTTTIEKGIETE